jgi:hypothetical protein
MSIFIRTLGNEKEKDSVELLMDEAKIALKKDVHGNYLLFDCSPLLSRLSHFHGGKQAVTAFFKGKAFLMDPGCCSYDDEDFSEYFKQSSSHTSLLVDGRGDSVLQGLYTWLAAPVCQVTDWCDEGTILSTMTSDAPGWENVKWERKLEFKEGKLEITDTVSAAEEHELSFIFALSSEVRCSSGGREILLTNGDVRVKAVFEYPAEVIDGKEFKNFVKVPSKHLVVRTKAACCTLKTLFVCE